MKPSRIQPTPRPRKETAELDAVLLVADAIGDVIEFWGFRKLLGRVWTVLFLEDECLSAEDLMKRLHTSAGSMSTALTELQRWGVVRRVPRLGQRKEYFEAETDFWKMVSRVISDRERTLVRSVRERIEQADGQMRTRPQTPALRKSRERLGQLLLFVRIGESVIDAFILSQKADFSRFGEVLAMARRARKRQ
jgi:DNA-binding transcriptional regulator GbsR (MarR family)